MLSGMSLRERGYPGSGPALRSTWLTPHCCSQEERPPYHRSKKGGSLGVCYLSMGTVVLLMGLVFASVYIYRYFFLAQVRGPAGGRRPGLGEGRGWEWWRARG